MTKPEVVHLQLRLALVAGLVAGCSSVATERTVTKVCHRTLASSRDPAAEKIFKARVRVLVDRRRADGSIHSVSGTGFFISPRVIVTARHVIRQAAAVTVMAYQHSRHRQSERFHWRSVAEIADQTAAKDTALLLVRDLIPPDIVPLLVRSTPPRKGEMVWHGGMTSYCDRGIVLATGLPVRNTPLVGIAVAETDADDGDSGGPVTDSDGAAIGVLLKSSNYERLMVFAPLRDALLEMHHARQYHHPVPKIPGS